MPDSASGASAFGEFYATLMPGETAGLFRLISADTDFTPEIRLMRLLNAFLAQDCEANHAHITRVMAALVRALDLQSRRDGTAEQIALALEEAGDRVLALLEEESD